MLVGAIQLALAKESGTGDIQVKFLEIANNRLSIVIMLI
jgi:hypothetical protein